MHVWGAKVLLVFDCQSHFSSPSKNLDSVVNKRDTANEDNVAGQVDIEECSARVKLGAHKEQILDDDDDNEHWHLVLDTFIDETNCFHSFQTNVKRPSKAH